VQQDSRALLQCTSSSSTGLDEGQCSMLTVQSGVEEKFSFSFFRKLLSVLMKFFTVLQKKKSQVCI
jgi:hypothetical protein